MSVLFRVEHTSGLSYQSQKRIGDQPLLYCLWSYVSRCLPFSHLTANSLAIIFLTWFGGVTLYNRLHLKRRGLSQFPLPSLHFPSISLPSRNSGEQSRPSWGSWRRRSNRSGAYDRVRAEEHDEEEEGFAARFSLEESDGDAEDITSESNVWRSHQQGQAEDRGKGKGKGKVGVHEGLINI